jgi:hypothetical protein
VAIQKISLEDDEFKLAFIQGTLAIDCLEITLTQNATDSPRIYTAAGSIFASPENGAEARLVWKRDADHPYDQIAIFNEMQRVKSGELIPADHYFALRAVDIAGNCWTHPAVLLKRDEKQHAEILTVSCDFIQVEIASDIKRTLVHYVFNDDLEMPMNVSLSSQDAVRGRTRLSIKSRVSAGVVDGMDVSYHQVNADKAGNSYELAAVAQAGKEPPTDFHTRLLEAIQFCVAKQAWPIMGEVIQGGKQIVTLSKSRAFYNGMVSAPLPSYASDEFYRLLECYYRYACSESNGADTAPLSKKIGGLFTLKGVWIDTIALLLSVSVESVLQDPNFKNLGKPDKGFMALLNKLFDWVKQAPVDESLIGRATSAMGTMKSNRAVDKMFVLAKAGVIDEEEIKAWKALRNPTAHGSFELDPAKLQDLLDNVYKLIAMIYKLAFFRVGYVGKFSDYAERGWREAHFDATACKAELDKIGSEAK